MLVDYVRVYQRMVNAGEDEKAAIMQEFLQMEQRMVFMEIIRLGKV